MGLPDIAAGLEVTARQRDRGVATVDGTDAPLDARLEPFAAGLPCSAERAAAVLDTYLGGASVGGAAGAAGLAPIEGAKVLHLLGVEGLSPVTPLGRQVVRDWLDARLPRTEAVELAGGDETEFALAAFVETHDPLDGARDVVDGAFLDGDASVDKRDALAETMSGGDGFY